MTHPSLSRRRFLISTAGVGAGAGLVPALALAQVAGEGTALPGYAAWKDAQDLIVHSEQTLETVRAAQGGRPITPAADLFVRNNVPPPGEEILADRDTWEVGFEGVAEPRAMRVGELKSLGAESVACVLQCSGNGRAFFDHETSGTQWTVGAAGNVLWTGVPLRAVVEALGGPAGGAAFVTATGGETIPEGLDPLTLVVERSVPLAALDRALLAYEMNGEPLSLAHGGPLRLVLPGYFGVNNVKYLRRVALTEAETEAEIQRTRYRLQPVGEEGDPSHPSVWEMPVKSWVTTPLMDAASGRVLIQGVAMGGVDALARVEVSTDGGESFQEARLTGPDLGSYAWRPFALAVALEPGSYLVASRAATTGGAEQPETAEPNDAGYSHNGWRAHAVELVVE